MRLTLHEATLAPRTGDVPVGAVMPSPDGTAIGRGRNERKASGDPTAHARVPATMGADKGDLENGQTGSTGVRAVPRQRAMRTPSSATPSTRSRWISSEK
ncbi:hypothetical protein ACFWVC_23935 [Streptomyces sp. NPDC058691]|uniref:hypothetical protein n=1 Tax=Streptomyces sp. NPDC058691 TaxID=3346601 RepID=UPI00365542AA